jgi:Sec-independent protein translocase protein TatA
MFDFDAGKLIIVGIVALIVIGPKELPRVMLQVGQAAAKMRRMAASAKPKSTILNPMWKGSRNARRPQQGWAR